MSESSWKDDERKEREKIVEVDEREKGVRKLKKYIREKITVKIYEKKRS